MSRFVPHDDMTASEITRCGTDAITIIALCENAAWGLAHRGANAEIAGHIQTALKLAVELLGPALDALDAHEGDAS